MESLVTWGVLVAICGFAIWMATRQAKQAGRAEAEAEAEAAARKAEQDMTAEVTRVPGEDETLDKLKKGEF